MKKSLSYFCSAGIVILLFYSCNFIPDIEEANVVVEEQEFVNSIIVPDGFDFSTQHQVEVTINDIDANVCYDVYAFLDEKQFAGSETFQNQEGETVTEDLYKSDVMSKLVFSGVPSGGVLKQTITLPIYYDKLYIRRNNNLKYSASIEAIVNNEVRYSYISPAKKELRRKSNVVGVVTDLLYCVNGSGELFQVDPAAFKFVTQQTLLFLS